MVEKIIQYTFLSVGLLFDVITFTAGISCLRTGKNTSGFLLVGLGFYFVACSISYKFTGSFFTMSLLQAVFLFMLVHFLASLPTLLWMRRRSQGQH